MFPWAGDEGPILVLAGVQVHGPPSGDDRPLHGFVAARRLHVGHVGYHGEARESALGHGPRLSGRDVLGPEIRREPRIT
jgi:hypothetical protein